MPSSTLDDLLERYGQVSAANRSVLLSFGQVAEQFQRQGIRVLLLKGADVITRLYGLRGTRPLSDVDLLVQADDLPAIDRLLTELGFLQQIDGNPSYVSPDRRLSLDLITTLWYLDERQLAEVWSRAITRPFPPVTIAALSTEDLLIHLTAYAVVHRGQLSAAFVQDLRLLIEKESPDWPTIVTRARDYDLRGPLYHGLLHIRRMVHDVAISKDVLSQLAPENRRETVRAWLLRQLVTREPLPELGHFLLFVTQRRGMRWSWLRRTLCPSSTFLSYRYGTGCLAAPWTTRLTRLCSLCAAALVLSARLLHRLISRPARPIL